MQEEHIRTTMNVKNLLKSASTDISEDSIQQMVEAAQESTRLAQENLKTRALKEEELRKKQEKRNCYKNKKRDIGRSLRKRDIEIYLIQQARNPKKKMYQSQNFKNYLSKFVKPSKQA